MRSFCLLLTLFVFLQPAPAQQRPDFHSQNYIGVLEGATSSSFQLQTINGVRYRNWFGGAGIGLDYYYYRTVPLFLSLTRYTGSGNNGFFFSIDGGINFYWGYRDKYGMNPTGTEGEFSPGLYYTGSAGYRIRLPDSKDAVMFNIGYSVKHLNETRGGACINPPCYFDRYDYRLNRLSLRLGWSF